MSDTAERGARVPMLRLRGHWLPRLGFVPGRSFSIAATAGRLLLTVAGPPPGEIREPLPPAPAGRSAKITAGELGEPAMPAQDEIQYITDEEGKPTGVIVPIDLWREIVSEKETAHLLRSDKMRQRLLAALERQDGIPLEVVREKLGI